MPTIDFLWDDWSDNVLQETNENNVVTTYIQRPEKHGEVLYDKQGNRFSYYHYDGNGSTRKLTGANQAVTKTYIFTGFGELIANPGVGSTPFAYKGAAGYYTNPVTNDIYVRARTYEPTTGRWLSKDPLGFVDGPNLYQAYFVPQTYDPSGCCLLCQEVAQSPTVLGPCGDAIAKVQWNIVPNPNNEDIKKRNGWIVQRIFAQISQYRCDLLGPVKTESKCFFEAWQVRNGTIFIGGSKNPHRPNFSDTFRHTVPKGEGTIGELSTEGQVAFIEDYDLKKPPWSFPGDQGHSSSATDLPTLDCTNGPPTGWASAQKMSRKLVSKWQCCCRNRIETDLSDSEGWYDRCI